MRSEIFVRPNLKGFVFGAAFLLCFHVVMQQLEGRVSVAARPTVPVSVRQWTESDFLAMHDHVTSHPTAEGYYKLGAYLESQKDFKRAMIYFRQAEVLCDLDEEP